MNQIARRISLVTFLFFVGVFTYPISISADAIKGSRSTQPVVVSRGDVNGDGKIDLADAIVSMQLAAGVTPQVKVYKAADVDIDGKIGLVEAIFVLQFFSELREVRAITYPHLDSVVKHTSDDPNDLTWTSYVSSRAAALPHQYILLCADGGGDEYTVNWAIGNSDWLGRNPRFSKFIILSVAIYRDPIYAVTFPRDVFLEETEDRFYRPDLKVNDILDSFIEELNEAGLNVKRRVLVSGFSNGGMFANRYTLLHPDRIQAAAIGQAGGALTLPMKNHNDVDISWPAGVFDFELLTGKEFDFDTYASIPKFIYIGEMDTGPYQSTVYSPVFGWNLEVFSEEQCEFMYNLAPTDPERIQVQTAIMRDLGDNVVFRMYPGVGHTCEECPWEDDVITFLEENSYYQE